MPDEFPIDAGLPADTQTRPTFGRRLAVAFASVAALTVILVAIMTSLVWNHQFDQYLKGNLQRIAEGVAQIASEAYPQYGGWTIQTLSVVPRMGSMRGIAIQIHDAHNTLIYDDTINYRANQAQRASAGQGVTLNPAGDVVTAPIVVDGIKVGSVAVWAYGEGALLTDRDAQFRSGSLTALTVAALVAVAFASLGGMLYSTRLVQPITAITATAQALRQGDREARTGFDGEDEISILGKTFDEMADAIEADRELERRLTADVAHELRTPLQAIQATVEAMQDGVLPADEERLGIVRDETVRLGRLADAILELTRLERGSVPFAMRRIDLGVPVHSAVDTLAALIDSNNLSLSVDVAENMVVIGDVDRLQQAVAGLLGNAARYTPAGGSISVSVKADNGCAVVEVADTGIGIAEENLPHVFGRFWRADEARASSTGGLGIGLAVAKEIVERHKGTISCARRDGGGTVFTIKLPRAGESARLTRGLGARCPSAHEGYLRR